MRCAARFARKRCAIGQSQKLDLEDDAGILAALRLVTGASAATGQTNAIDFGKRILAIVLFGSKSLKTILRFILRVSGFITERSRIEKVTL